MNWINRKTVGLIAIASAVTLVVASCGSEPDQVPASGGDPSPAPTAVPTAVPTATPVPDGDDDEPSGGVLDYLALARALEDAGVNMAESDMVFPPTLFEVDGRVIEVGGEQDAAIPALVFSFDGVAAREAAEATIDLDAGSVGDNPLDDYDRLAFFADGAVIVMYIGDNPDTIDLLGSILGEPIGVRSDMEDPDPSASVRETVEAPIESVEILIMESDPVQVSVRIVAGLQNGCQEPASVSTHRADDLFGITVLNSRPALEGIICTDDYRVYEENVPIGSREPGAEFKAGVTYTLVVNDMVLEFTVNGVVNEDVTLSGYDAVILTLAAEGAAPQATAEVIGGVFGVDAGIIKLGNQEIQVHEFDTTAIADGMASGVTADGGTIKLPDGSVVSVRWIMPPHFFKADNVIVLYLGDDADTLSTLLGAFGASFAGAPIETGGEQTDPTPSPDDDPVPFPIPTQPAPIESVEVAFLESFPVQYLVQIVAGLENGCIEPHGSQVVTTAGEDGENVVAIEVTNVVAPPGSACDAAYRTYEENINLGTGFESGSEWDVFVNGELRTTFTAQ